MKGQPHRTKAALLARFAHRPAHKRLPTAPRRLDPTQLRDLSLCHHVNIDAISHGTADASMLWDFAGGVLTWWRAAQLMGAGEDQMAPQLALTARLVERYTRTRRLGFTGPDLELARDGVVVMDQLAALVDQRTALLAAQWSEEQCNRIANAADMLHAMRQASGSVAA